MLQNDDERKAYHEAGHAVVGCVMVKPLLSTTIDPLIPGAGGVTTFQGVPPEILRDEDAEVQVAHHERDVVIAEAGPLAEERATGQPAVERFAEEDRKAAEESAKSVYNLTREDPELVGTRCHCSTITG